MARSSLVIQNPATITKVSAQHDIPSYETLKPSQKETVDNLKMMFADANVEDLISLCHDLNYNFDICLDKLLALSTEGSLNMWSSASKRKSDKKEVKTEEKKKYIRVTPKTPVTPVKKQQQKKRVDGKTKAQNTLKQLEKEEQAFLSVAEYDDLTAAQKQKVDERREQIASLKKELGITVEETPEAAPEEIKEKTPEAEVVEEAEKAPENPAPVNNEAPNAPWNPYMYVPMARGYDPANPVFLPNSQPVPFIDAEGQQNNMQFMGYPLGYPMPMPMMGQPGVNGAYPMNYAPFMPQPGMPMNMPQMPMNGVQMPYPYPNAMPYMGGAPFSYNPDPNQQPNNFNQQ